MQQPPTILRVPTWVDAAVTWWRHRREWRRLKRMGKRRPWYTP